MHLPEDQLMQPCRDITRGTLHHRKCLAQWQVPAPSLFLLPDTSITGEVREPFHHEAISWQVDKGVAQSTHSNFRSNCTSYRYKSEGANVNQPTLNLGAIVLATDTSLRMLMSINPL